MPSRVYRGEEYVNYFIASYGPGSVVCTLTACNVCVHLNVLTNQYCLPLTPSSCHTAEQGHCAALWKDT